MQTILLILKFLLSKLWFITIPVLIIILFYYVTGRIKNPKKLKTYLVIIISLSLLSLGVTAISLEKEREEYISPTTHSPIYKDEK